MTALEPIGYLVSATQMMYGFMTKDLKAIGEGAAHVSPGGVAKTALRVVAECAMANGAIAMRLSGEEPPQLSDEAREDHLNRFDTVEKALAYLETETNRLVSVLEGLDAGTLGEIVAGPLGPMSKFALAHLASIHMMYHDGQLNYIQSLHGDGEIHWRD